MNGLQRKALINLLQEADLGLCHFCKYADWIGGSPCSGDCDMECCHKIDKIAENSWNVWQGDDCWAFRSSMPTDEMADIVGVLLLRPDNQGYTLDKDNGSDTWKVFVAIDRSINQ